MFDGNGNGYGIVHVFDNGDDYVFVLADVLVGVDVGVFDVVNDVAFDCFSDAVHFVSNYRLMAMLMSVILFTTRLMSMLLSMILF